jgi:hypothetical protein
VFLKVANKKTCCKHADGDRISDTNMSENLRDQAKQHVLNRAMFAEVKALCASIGITPRPANMKAVYSRGCFG